MSATSRFRTRTLFALTGALLALASMAQPDCRAAGKTGKATTTAEASIALEADVKTRSDPKRTLEAFLAAKNVDELLKHVKNRTATEREIRAFYKVNRRKPIEPQKVEADNVGLIPGRNLQAFMYWVTVNNRKIPVSVEETKRGFKVDWAAFNQFKDASFEKFIAKPGAKGGRFFVQLRRSHFFGNDVADIDDLHSYRIQSPIAPFEDAFAFLKKSQPDAKTVVDNFAWGKGYHPVAELKWVTPEGGKPRIEIVKIVRNTWREKPAP